MKSTLSAVRARAGSKPGSEPYRSGPAPSCARPPHCRGLIVFELDRRSSADRQAGGLQAREPGQLTVKPQGGARLHLGCGPGTENVP